MRIVFMGTGEIALPALRWLLDHRGEGGEGLVAVYTQPDKPVGRRHELTAPEAKRLAEASGVPVFQPERLRGDEAALAQFAELRPDLAVVMAYGQLLPRALLAVPRLGCVNLHASLLPRHRGASPIQAAIREGDAESGITLMHIVPKLDAGPILLKRALPIRPEDTGGSLHDRLAELGPEVVEAGLRLFRAGRPEGEPQDEALVTHCGKLSREDGEIDWSARAEDLERLVRAYDPWPGTATGLDLGEGRRSLKIFPPVRVVAGSGAAPGTVLEAGPRLIMQCGEDALEIAGEVQLEGRRRLPVADFLRGLPLKAGFVL
jgi:methionyl-tRNA formyltransferase